MIAGNWGTQTLKMNFLNQIHCKSPPFPTNSKQTLPIIIHSNLRRLAACTDDDGLPVSKYLLKAGPPLRWLKYSWGLNGAGVLRIKKGLW